MKVKNILKVIGVIAIVTTAVAIILKLVYKDKKEGRLIDRLLSLYNDEDLFEDFEADEDDISLDDLFEDD